MNALDIKVMRDLMGLRGQVISIALLIAAGVAVFVMSTSNYLALVNAMEVHYRDERFADLFAGVKRAPLPVADKLREVDGIGLVLPRVSQAVRVLRPDSDISVSGRLLSIPAGGQPLLNRLYLTRGRWLDPARADEIIINEAFAKARSIRPGDTVDVIVNGRLQDFRVAGMALSPEFVFAARPGVPLPDDRNFVVMWAAEETVESAFDMRGAFNDVVMTVAPGALTPAVIEQIDRILEPYGGTGAYERTEQFSNRFVQDELAEQETVSIVMPTVFFGIAAFLLFVVLGRLIETQREQIAALKALGFGNRPIAIHYFKLVTTIAVLGSGAGLLLGYWAAVNVITSYRAFFRFPTLEPQLDPWIIAIAVIASIVVANAAALRAVLSIVRLPPAEAMRSQVPATSAVLRSLSGRLGKHVPVQYLMTMRAILGRPVRTALTILGIALAFPLVLFGLFWFDTIDYMLDVAFSHIERSDALVVFSTPVHARALQELRAFRGVVQVEGQRIVPVRLVAGHRSYRLSITGLTARPDLKVHRDRHLNRVSLPPDGLVVSRPLAERLRLAIGAQVRVEVLEGQRQVFTVPLAKLSDDILGYSAVIRIDVLNRVLQEADHVNAAAITVDPLEAHRVWRELNTMPVIEASSVKSLWLTLFDETFAGMIRIGALILFSFGLLIAVGVVYNSARVAFHERAWELAGLRIIGFSKAEVATVLLSELGLQVLVALPIGLLLGYGLIDLIMSLRASESFQVPVVIAPTSYAFAALAVIAAAASSGYAVWKRIDSLDIVSVLKTRD